MTSNSVSEFNRVPTANASQLPQGWEVTREPLNLDACPVENGVVWHSWSETKVPMGPLGHEVPTPVERFCTECGLTLQHTQRIREVGL